MTTAKPKAKPGAVEIVDVVLRNESDLPDGMVEKVLRERFPEIATLERWSEEVRGRNQGLFERDHYVNPRGLFNEFRTALDAAETDDIVANALETTEQLAFRDVAIECDDEDEEDIWDQILDDLDIEAVLRRIWRELFVISNVYISVLYGRRTYKVNGKSDNGVRRKKVYKNLKVPIGISILDPVKVVPVGNFMFQQEELAYIAKRGEATEIRRTLAGSNTTDLVVTSLLTKQYDITPQEAQQIRSITGDSFTEGELFLFNPDRTFRITSTRPDYERFATCRMRSVFELLDMKSQLRQQDRAFLLGAARFIVLVKKGSDERPANSAEIASLASQVGRGSNPVIVGDHRIDIEIITPKMDHTLAPERYNALDSRIAARLYQVMMTGSYCLTPDTEILTNEGWRTHDQVGPGISALTLNPTTLESEWQDIQAVNVFDHKGPMLSMESNSHSSMSTLNHRWFVQSTKGRDKRKEWGFATSESLRLSDRIPTVAPNGHGDFPEFKTHSDELVEIAAWYMTEGHRNGGSPNRVTISQSITANPDKCDQIEKALTSLLGAPGKVSEGGLWYRMAEEYQICSEGTQTLGLLELFENDRNRKVPNFSFLFSLTIDQMRRFVNISLAGDGHTETLALRDRQRFFQKDKDIVDRYEMCLLMLGSAVRSSLAPSREESGVWTIEHLSHSFTLPLSAAHQKSKNQNPCQQGHASIDLVEYDGIVWCPTLPNGTWFARRNGKIFITGNSAGAPTDDSIKLSRVIAASMEARRDRIRAALMKHIIRPTYEANDQLLGRPAMKFRPNRVSLDFDPNVLNFIQDARINNQISRHTYLSELNIDEKEEAKRRELEMEKYDKFFEPPIDPNLELQMQHEENMQMDQQKLAEAHPPDPVAAPAAPGKTPAKQAKPANKNAATQKTAGRTGGGNNNGGGINTKSGKSGPGPGQGKPKSRAELETEDLDDVVDTGGDEPWQS